MKAETLYPVIHYLAALVFIGFYGVQVCPFIESLTSVQLATPLIIIVGIQYLLRSIIVNRIIENTPYEIRVMRKFQLEWALFLFSGILLTFSNSIFYDFPVASGLKMILGFATVGFFVSIDVALQEEHRLALFFRRQDITIVPKKSYFPLVKKFSTFAIASILFLISIFFLVISKDLKWLAEIGQQITMSQAQRSVMIEFAFIGAVMLGYMLIVILSYARNLQHFFNSENQVLEEATAGNLENFVTVSTNDEFGVMAHHTNIMIDTLLKRTHELQKTRDATILSLATLAETRDNETGAHILRTQHYVRALAIYLRDQPRFMHELNDETIDLLYKSAPLHDIGKVGIPDKILLKPDKLDVDEFEIMKTHTTLGGEALEKSEQELGTTSFLYYAREIAITHHEKWDGSGYPNGLKGDEIPVSGRLMAVADVYDALISKRVYKPAFPHEKAIEIILEGRGNHFDSDVVDALVSIQSEFKEISLRYTDDCYA